MVEFKVNPDLLYVLPVETHTAEELIRILGNHPEVQFVSFVGIDLAGNDTDEKIPISLFLDSIDDYLNGCMVQTDGSSVVLPGIATLNDGRVDFEADKDVVWFIDYNYEHIHIKTGKPVGTLRIPSFLIHNNLKVCSRSILKRACQHFAEETKKVLSNKPELCETWGIHANDIDHVELLSATELEFWVSSPDEKISAARLTVSESLKEQYWKRTKGVVRTALEQVILLLELYGFQPEMAHKEVGGVKAHLSGQGDFHNIMEQLEVDWRYAEALQSADYEINARIMIKEVFRMHGLDVSFSAKPLSGVAGSGEHTHINAVAYLKNGKKVNLFSPKDMNKDFLSLFGWGALFGFMKHYSLVNPFISVTNDSFRRLQPGFEAPTHPVASLGRDLQTPSRNRTVLLGLIRNSDSASQTRFEVRSPNPHTNTYLCLAASIQSMLDGVRYAVNSGRSTTDLEREFCKNAGDDAEYLEKDRMYRSEDDLFQAYSEKERDELFGTPPATVYESLRTLLQDDHLMPVLCDGDVFSDGLFTSYARAMLNTWQLELAERIIPDNLTQIKEIVPLHNPVNAYDEEMWAEIARLRHRLSKDTKDDVSIFTEIRMAIDGKNYKELSRLQLLMNKLQSELVTRYNEYCQNQI
jgi:glutamine synthetase